MLSGKSGTCFPFFIFFLKGRFAPPPVVWGLVFFGYVFHPQSPPNYYVFFSSSYIYACHIHLVGDAHFRTNDGWQRLAVDIVLLLQTMFSLHKVAITIPREASGCLRCGVPLVPAAAPPNALPQPSQCALLRFSICSFFHIETYHKKLTDFSF